METEALSVTSLHYFPVEAPGAGGLGPAPTGVGARPGEIQSGREARLGGLRKVSTFPPAAVFIDSL